MANPTPTDTDKELLQHLFDLKYDRNRPQDVLRIINTLRVRDRLEARIDELKKLDNLVLPYVCNGKQLADGVPYVSILDRIKTLEAELKKES